jgi:hypothetical protein
VTLNSDPLLVGERGTSSGASQSEPCRAPPPFLVRVCGGGSRCVRLWHWILLVSAFERVWLVLKGLLMFTKKKKEPQNAPKFIIFNFANLLCS